MRTSLDSVADDLAAGTTTSEALLEECLDRAGAPDGEGERVFRVLSADSARSAAVAIDKARRDGTESRRFAGIPISIKDLFDVASEQTLAGSRVLASAPLATADAPAIARLRAAGFVFVGRTNMTEFAYSGLGMNPHYGTPKNPWDRQNARIPGGSSSGAAISVTDGMALAGIGTDTGGSCRIPAAMSGITGYKPTARRVSLEGVVPLSSSLDSVGPLANTVACCAHLDAIMAGIDAPLEQVDVSGLRIAILQNLVFGDIDDVVARTFDAAISKISGAGATVEELSIDTLDELPRINSKGGLAAAEAYRWHKQMLEENEALYDPRVSVRIKAGMSQTPEDYQDLLQARERLIGDANNMTQQYDAVVYPTVPIVAPRIDDLADDDAYARTNILALRNPSIGNFLDRCAVSIPIHQQGEAPVGVNIMGEHLQDRRVLAVARAVEALLDRAQS